MAEQGKERRQAAGNDREKVITSTMVARAAGVSQSTVSLVLSGKSSGRVSQATQQMVEETARQLGYRPNLSAQTLRTGIVKTLAFAIPDLQQPFFGQVLYAAKLAASQRDYNLILLDTISDPCWAERLLQMYHSQVIAGCIVYAGDKAAEQQLAPMQQHVLYIEADDEALSGIDLDSAQVVRQAVHHLTGLGHQRIGYLSANYPRALFKRRFAAFRQTLEALNLPFLTDWHLATGFAVEEATLCARQLLSTDITAVICDDDLLAGAVYRAARQMGKIIPDSLSVIGFNDVEIARMLSPELTTIAIPADEIGRRSVELLLSDYSGSTPAGVNKTPLLLNLTLQVRQSTGPVSEASGLSSSPHHHRL